MILILYLACYALLALKNFRLAVGWLILCLPAYLIRFNFGNLPTTLLELNFAIIFFIWLIRYFKNDWPIIKQTISNHKLLFIFIGLFFISSLFNVFYGAAGLTPLGHYILKGIGLWRAYFLEPLLFFFILIGRSAADTADKTKIHPKNLIQFLIFSTISIGLLAIIQKITGQWYPPGLWNDELSGRVTAFFTSPNAIGLYVGPIIGLMAAVVIFKIIPPKAVEKTQFNFLHAVPHILILLIALVAIFFTYSQGTWVALAAGFILLIALLGYKKSALLAIIAAMALSVSIPSLKNAILFQDQAGRNRLELWKHSIQYVASSPTKFILGAGLRQFFRKVEQPYYDVKQMERLIYPHNIFLNFWVETGLFGLLSFVGILGYAFYFTNRLRKKNNLLGVGLLSALTIFLIHGLVDVSYFKNDLSMIFWIIIAITIAGQNKSICKVKN